jgi:hypothetical protein
MRAMAGLAAPVLRFSLLSARIQTATRTRI